MDKQELRGTIARAWCHPKNAHKEMDADLVDAIVEELTNPQPVEAKEEGEICPTCQGNGSHPEHHHGCDPQKGCVGECPIEVQCEHCGGTGRVEDKGGRCPLGEAGKGES